MNRTKLQQLDAPVLLLLALLLGTAFVSGCGMLDVTDPIKIEDTDIDNAAGADLVRRAALTRLASAVGRQVFYSGMLADEFLADPNPSTAQTGAQWIDEVLDRRRSQEFEDRPNTSGDYAAWQTVRLETSMALPRLRTYMPEPARSAYLGQMLAVRGFAALHLAEQFCPGFPLNDVVDYKVVYGAPRTTAEAFEQALADFDSAVVLAVDSARFLEFARVGQARTLLGLGRFAEAAQAAAPVPTAYVWNTEYSSSVAGPSHTLRFTRSATNNRRSVADREGGSGLDFVSANDPRVGTTYLGLAYDDVTEIRAIAKYPTTTAPIVLASGIEARLIEAEAALRAGNPQWLVILNDLRRTQITPALLDTTDPGTEAARVDLLFRERAFWLFATGHRLGDLRRLVQHYGRSPESVFPSGAYRVDGLYDAGTSMPFPAAAEAANNPAVTGCTSR